MWKLRTGCRLHFGLMELYPQAAHRFAGLGVMLQQPSLILKVSESAAASHSIATRAAVAGQSGTLAKQLFTNANLDSASQCEFQRRIQTWLSEQSTSSRTIKVEIESAYPFHCGLGSGTQLGCLLAFASNLLANADSPEDLIKQLKNCSPTQLAAWSGRGLRSAIGLQGFLSGGLIMDSGYDYDSGQQRPVTSRVTQLPVNWRFVLLRGAESSTITGQLENQLVGRIASGPNPNCGLMMKLAHQIFQAGSSGHFDQFCDLLEQYMSFAGQMFEAVQGGPYNGAVCTQAVALAQRVGLRAVGQSSWGPTIFGLSESPAQASAAIEQLKQLVPNWIVISTPAAVSGVQIEYQK